MFSTSFCLQSHIHSVITNALQLIYFGGQRAMEATHTLSLKQTSIKWWGIFILHWMSSPQEWVEARKTQWRWQNCPLLGRFLWAQKPRLQLWFALMVNLRARLLCRSIHSVDLVKTLSQSQHWGNWKWCCRLLNTFGLFAQPRYLCTLAFLGHFPPGDLSEKQLGTWWQFPTLDPQKQCSYHA